MGQEEFPPDHKKVWCTKCHGTGKLFIGKNNRQIKCYECDGYGFEWVPTKN